METLVNQATDEKQTRENWGLYARICEMCSGSPDKARDAVAAIAKRAQSKNANAVLFALTLANCLVVNCGQKVHREVSSRVLVDALVKQLMAPSVHRAVKMRIAELIQSWALLFKNNPDLGYLVQTYDQLKHQGIQFPSPNAKPETVKSASALAKEQEEEELQLALALSMSAEEHGAKQQQTKRDEAPTKRNPICRVRALYDFPGLEEGELRLTFNDIVNVHDDTTFKEWWKGECNGRIGIFPSNYVERIEGGVGGASAAPPASAAGLPDDQKVDRFMGLLANANPRESLSENAQVQELYHAILMLRPKLLGELEVSRVKQDELVAINERFTAACSTYQKLMDASLAAQRTAYQQHPQYAPQGYGNYGAPPAPFQQGPPQYPQQQQPYMQQPPPQQYQQQPPPGQYAPAPQGYASPPPAGQFAQPPPQQGYSAPPPQGGQYYQ
ncbi:ESCRT-0 subunit protein hse1 [Podochytrium sp. JEL0797]|nr:ESCRT-0 subunit protein hse1 [Podochytrium sp. JEL0797]